MSFAINPHNSWLALEERAAAEQNPRRKALVTAVRDHMEYEIKGQLEPLMDTLTTHPVYHFWGQAEPSTIEGRDAVRGFYSAMFDTGGQQFEVVIDKVVVSDNHVITEGQVKQVHKGASLAATGIGEVAGEPVRDDDLFVATAQLVTLWPGDAENKLIGEDIYFGTNAFSAIERVTRDRLPPYYSIFPRYTGT